MSVFLLSFFMPFSSRERTLWLKKQSDFIWSQISKIGKNLSTKLKFDFSSKYFIINLMR
jgi:hypothetical protein